MAIRSIGLTLARGFGGIILVMILVTGFSVDTIQSVNSGAELSANVRDIIGEHTNQVVIGMTIPRYQAWRRPFKQQGEVEYVGISG